MGTTLTGTTPQDTYDSLIKVTDNGPLSATAKLLTDGLGNNSILALSTTAVGIGTTSPTANLDARIAGTTSGAVIKVGNVGTGDFGGLGVSDGGTYPVQLYGSSLAFLTGNSAYASATEKVRITSAGNVGIGTSAPATALQVGGVVTSGVTSVADGKFDLKRSSDGLSVANFDIDSANSIARISTAYSFLTLATEGVERFRITNNGVTFNGDTAAANALNDYETGTWTPTVTAASGAATYSTQFGSYTKIGRQVTINWFVSFQKNTLSGFVSLSGFPFALASLSSSNYPQAAILIDNLASAYDNPILQLNNGGTDGNILLNNGSTTSHAAMADTQLGAGTMAFRGTATYFV